MGTQRKSYTQEEILEKFGNRDFRITPETFKMGIHHVLGAEIAKRFGGRKVIADVCTGGGFTALCLAREVERVVAVDIDSERLALVRANADIADLSNKFEFICGNTLDERILDALRSNAKVEAISADPDWALPGHEKGDHATSMYDMGPPVDTLLTAFQTVTPHIAIRLPKEINLQELDLLPPHETEAVFLDGTLKFYMLYFGDLARSGGVTKLEIENKK